MTVGRTFAGHYFGGSYGSVSPGLIGGSVLNDATSVKLDTPRSRPLTMGHINPGAIHGPEHEADASH
jgi:hypothetical protein